LLRLREQRLRYLLMLLLMSLQEEGAFLSPRAAVLPTPCCSTWAMALRTCPFHPRMLSPPAASRTGPGTARHRSRESGSDPGGAAPGPSARGGREADSGGSSWGLGTAGPAQKGSGPACFCWEEACFRRVSAACSCCASRLRGSCSNVSPVPPRGRYWEPSRGPFSTTAPSRTPAVKPRGGDEHTSPARILIDPAHLNIPRKGHRRRFRAAKGSGTRSATASRGDWFAVEGAQEDGRSRAPSAPSSAALWGDSDASPAPSRRAGSRR
jgi:hypothetical protein